MEPKGEIKTSVSRINDSGSGKDGRVGLLFDERMCKHYNPYEDHVECPDRIRVIWERLSSSGLAKRCIILNAKDAEDNHLALVHSKNHIDLIKNISSKNSKPKRKKIADKFNSIYFNEGSTEAAYLAAGSVIEAAEKVAKGELDSAFAIVRPPGHHAEEDEPMGFCLYNNVGIAASYLLNERRELGINKILIVDWDVHHGNGTQKMFYKDPRVLFFSVHRYDNGTFYPAGHDGSYIMTGEDQGAGHNINVPWEHGKCGDADYLAVWEHILIPVAKEFNPDMILISAGFDAAIGDPLGGCRISPYGYSVMLDKLMEFAGGKIVMALEGGYNLNSISCSAQACVEVLLHEKPSVVVLETQPFASTWRVIEEVRQELSTYWPVLAVELPEKKICKTPQIEPYIILAGSVATREKQDEILECLRAMNLNLAEISTSKVADAKLHASVSRMDAQIKTNHSDVQVSLLAMMDHTEQQFSDLHHQVDYVIMKRVEDLIATERSTMAAHLEATQQIMEAKMAVNRAEVEARDHTTRETIRVLVAEAVSKLKDTLVDNAMINLAQRDNELKQKLDVELSSLQEIAERIKPMVQFIKDTQDATQATLKAHDALIAQLSVHLSKVESHVVVEAKRGGKKSGGKELATASVTRIPSQLEVVSAETLAKQLEVLHVDRDQLKRQHDQQIMEAKLATKKAKARARENISCEAMRVLVAKAVNELKDTLVDNALENLTQREVELKHKLNEELSSLHAIAERIKPMVQFIKDTHDATQATLKAHDASIAQLSDHLSKVISHVVVEAKKGEEKSKEKDSTTLSVAPIHSKPEVAIVENLAKRDQLKRRQDKSLSRGGKKRRTILSSDSEAETENITLTVSEEVQTIDDVIQPFSNLKVDSDNQDQDATVKSLLRSELSKVDVWYATYGSNMNMSRFICYIEGGQIEGMMRPCVGSMDKSKPKEIIWKNFPHRLFFARERTATWGPGGVAFLHPSSNVQEKAYLCLYKITLEQFNDVLLQENVLSPDMSHPLFDLTALQTIQTEKSISMELVQRGWYHNVVYLGNEGGIPILTMTCSLFDVDNFLSGTFPINPPCKEYANTLIQGLVEGKQLSEEEASAYIQEASSKPL